MPSPSIPGSPGGRGYVPSPMADSHGSATHSYSVKSTPPKCTPPNITSHSTYSDFDPLGFPITSEPSPKEEPPSKPKHDPRE